MSRKYKEKRVDTIPLQEGNQKIEVSVSDFPDLVESRAFLRA